MSFADVTPKKAVAKVPTKVAPKAAAKPAPQKQNGTPKAKAAPKVREPKVPTFKVRAGVTNGSEYQFTQHESYPSAEALIQRVSKIINAYRGKGALREVMISLKNY